MPKSIRLISNHDADKANTLIYVIANKVLYYKANSNGNGSFIKLEDDQFIFVKENPDIVCQRLDDADKE